MDFLWDSITDWLKELLVSGILSNLSGMFDSVNDKVGDISTQVGMTPRRGTAAFSAWCRTSLKPLSFPSPG